MSLADDKRRRGASVGERRARERGARRAEALARWVLRLKGYRILAQRARTSAGEIDIVAVRGRRLVFVEVKQRATLTAAAISVSQRQAGRIHRAANAWLQRNAAYIGYDLGFDRFDVAGPLRFRHAIDALQPIR